MSRRSLLVFYRAGFPALMLILGGLAAGCSQDSVPSTEFHFDRPTDMAFGCVSFAGADGGIDMDQARAVPLSECATAPAAPANDAGVPTTDAGVPPAVRLIGFTAQSTRGNVVVSNLTRREAGDSDPLTPGHNGLTVGEAPVSADTTPDGCGVVVANQGSCTLTQIDVFKAAAGSVIGNEAFRRDSTRTTIVTAAGGAIAAAPTSVVTPPPATARSECTETPAGLAYVAYPNCHMVAAVELATGKIVSSVTFPLVGAPVVGGDDVTCPAECSGIPGAAVPGAEPAGAEPTVLAMDPAGDRLYVGARDQAAIYVIDLAVNGTFGATSFAPLEDSRGVLRIAASKELEMGQDSAEGQGAGGIHRFVYAITQDGSIRVVEVSPFLAEPQECDTQADPRLTRAISDPSLLACVPVKDQPILRRPGARGPGIRLPGDAVPFDVAFIQGSTKLDPQIAGREQPSPSLLNGTFAMVTSKDATLVGAVYYIDVDDENYEDVFDPAVPRKVEMTLALPHHLRDNVFVRRYSTNTCTDDTTLQDAAKGPVRVLSAVEAITAFVRNASLVVNEADYTEGAVVPGRIAPMLHLETCQPTDSMGNPMGARRAVLQGTAASPDDVLIRAFPDLGSAQVEKWSVTWEGALGATDFDASHQGGQLAPVPGRLELALTDDARPFCGSGVEDHDIVRLLGCASEADCGPDEGCFIDAETPAGLTGMCLPDRDIDRLAAQCHALLISTRQYLVKKSSPTEPSVRANQLVLVPKPSTLMTSPLQGCTSNEQCQQLYVDEVAILAADGSGEVADKTYACQTSEELGGSKRCIAVCPGNTNEECPVGSVCQDLRCVEGAFAPAECTAPLQLYQLSGGGAYVVTGSKSGYIHHRVTDADGVCVADAPPVSPPANGDLPELRIGRFRPIEPPCVGDDDLSPEAPNPCSITLDEPVAVKPTEGTTSTLGTRASPGIRFRNTAFRIDFADVYSQHPPRKDAAGNVVPDPLTDAVLEVSLAMPQLLLRFGFDFVVGGGFIPRSVIIPQTLLPARIRSGPDGAVWVLDSADVGTNAGTQRGMIIRITSENTFSFLN